MGPKEWVTARENMKKFLDEYRCETSFLLVRHGVLSMSCKLASFLIASAALTPIAFNAEQNCFKDKLASAC